MTKCFMDKGKLCNHITFEEHKLQAHTYAAAINCANDSMVKKARGSVYKYLTLRINVVGLPNGSHFGKKVWKFILRKLRHYSFGTFCTQNQDKHNCIQSKWFHINSRSFCYFLFLHCPNLRTSTPSRLIRYRE